MATRGLPGPPAPPNTRNKNQNQNLTFYPAYCYKASPTYFTWVKLTALDIHHTLSTRRGFEGQNLYFYLNHPVQFVYIVGVVVAYEDFHERRWVMVVDDGSGATLEVTCPKPAGMKKPPAAEASKVSDSEAELRRFAEQQARADTIASVDVGSVVKVKGRVGLFRDTRQIHLERIAVVGDTNAEMRFWEERMKLKIEVLAKPWVVSAEEQRDLLKVADGRERDERVQVCKWKEREAAGQAREWRHAEKIARRYRQEEVRRAKAAEVARKAGRIFMSHLSRKRDMSIGTVNEIRSPK